MMCQASQPRETERLHTHELFADQTRNPNSNSLTGVSHCQNKSFIPTTQQISRRFCTKKKFLSLTLLMLILQKIQ